VVAIIGTCLAVTGTGLGVGRAQAATANQAIAWLSAQRAANGIPGGINENFEWDSDCQAHDNWMYSNNQLSHDETPGTPGYTQGGAYAGQNSVLAQGTDWSPSSRYPWGATNPWETAPIHLIQLLSPDLAASGFANYQGYSCMFTWPGYQRPAPASPELITYPGNGTSFIYPSEQADEAPFTPGDFVGIRNGTTTGPYIYVFGYGTGRGAITNASLTGPSGPVQVRTVDNTTKGSQGDLGSYLPAGGIIIPVSPLTPGASYTATVTFSPNASDWNDSAYGNQPPSGPLSRTWSFRTVVGSGPGTAPMCMVPRLRHLTLPQARRALTAAHCALGKVRRPKHVRPGRVLRVNRQSATAGSRHPEAYAVSVTLV
jgi:hypothetical protein